MKKLVIISLTLIVFFGCSDDTVNLEPIGATEASFFQNEEQMTQAVFGTYQKLNFFHRWVTNNHLMRVGLLPSDDVTVIGNFPHESFVSLNGNDGQTNDVYLYAYQLIARANVLLEKIDENGSFAYDDDSDLDDIHRGEALFLRSLMNFKLWNVFGTAPLVTERILDLADASPPNTTGTELLDQAVLDFTQAIELLPENWDDSNIGRATKNSARGMLLKTLVFRGTVNGDNADFTRAITIFNSINGAALTANYVDNFNYQTENNSESLFEYQSSSNTGFPVNGWLPSSGNDGFAVIGEINSYFDYWTGNPFAAIYRATNSLIDAYEEGDPRISINLIPEAEEGMNVLKYHSTDRKIAGAIPAELSSNNVRILRYADAVLLAAEAIVRSGGSLAEATDLVNSVRERARNSYSILNMDEAGEVIVPEPSPIPADLPVFSNPNEALTAIFEERRLELFGEEGHRWYDLRRRHFAGEIDLTTWDFDSADPNFQFSENNVLFPLPENEVVQNPNLNQNPGY